MTEHKNSFDLLQSGRAFDPFTTLGRHRTENGIIIRAFLPTARCVELIDIGPMYKMPGYDIWEKSIDSDSSHAVDKHYRLRWKEIEGDTWIETISAYSFDPILHDDDLHLFGEGCHHHAYRFLGAHLHTIEDVEGCLFSVWAPAVERVSVVGDFNSWNGLRHPMRVRGASGIWELFIPGLTDQDLYKFEIRNRDGHVFLKADPYARQMTLRPDTACQIVSPTTYVWEDDPWLTQRGAWDWQHRPMAIYEVHLGSWRRGDDNEFLDYATIADQLIPYVTDMGFTHIELLPVMEHPLDESWGYQVSGFFAPTARYGSPDGLRYLIDHCHQAGIGVLLDWVPGHFPRDAFALARFSGEPLYEHADPRRGEHRDWGTLIFDYGRNEVRNFLLTNAVYWCEEFHIDGLRVDAVASMLYLDYSREADDWLPNREGGRENLEAIAFFHEFNRVLHARFPGLLTIAEESTAWPMVSRPVEHGGLGFSMKWNMGWMNDTLHYFELDPVYRRFHQDKLTFGQMYAYSENFVLPLSHDEVVHLKGSLMGKMPGDVWQKIAGVRLLLAWQYATPGKKLLFMGGELAQHSEWREDSALDWAVLKDEAHLGVQKVVRDLNALYNTTASMHRFDFEPVGFEWINCDDEEHSVLVFVRKDGAQHIMCVFNMTPVVRHHYRIGVPSEGTYHEVLNTDAGVYGGSNTGNFGRVVTQPVSFMGQAQSVELTLPPLAAVFLSSKG